MQVNWLRHVKLRNHTEQTIHITSHLPLIQFQWWNELNINGLYSCIFKRLNAINILHTWSVIIPEPCWTQCPGWIITFVLVMKITNTNINYHCNSSIIPSAIQSKLHNGRRTKTAMYKMFPSCNWVPPSTVFTTHSRSTICTFASTCSLTLSSHHYRLLHHVHHTATLYSK